ncbi:MAG: hypothetical protein MUP90_06630 [Gammaproteobacteria bacterium]|nr:hypothetical protein [Gammaproteobacteria bacterium]
MDHISATLRYCFNPFEFCIESDDHADTDRAADVMAEQLADDYRVAIVRLHDKQTQLSQHHDEPFLTVHMPLDHHRLRRPLRLLDADVVIVSGPSGGKLARVLLSADIDNTMAGAITCLHDLKKTASLKRATRNVSNWLEQRASKVPVYGLLMDEKQGHSDAAGRAAALLSGVCSRTFVYAPGKPNPDYPSIGRRFPDNGLMGAILSAQLEYPEVAWMVMNAGHTEVQAGCMQFMLEHRNPFRYVTAFRGALADDIGSNDTGDLCGIWEPKSHRRLLEGMGCGVSCPEELLEGSPHSLLKVPQTPK